MIYSSNTWRIEFTVLLFWCLFFFFKQKTAYEMRISDWSSDVCSSDLRGLRSDPVEHPDAERRSSPVVHERVIGRFRVLVMMVAGPPVMAVMQIGRASCRERVCQYV